jgi:pyruvate dehydrogenase E2 component (dihydrolipoamide acetyltransferase)
MTTRVDLVMPKLGLTMTEGKVARWAVAPGAAFAAGDVVVVVETDKIAFDVEAPGAGQLADVLVPEGETVAVGTPIAQWLPVAGGASLEAAESVLASAPAVQRSPSVPTVAPPKAHVPSTGARIVATPFARRIAREAALDLATMTPSNARRITAADVHAAIARGNALPPAVSPRKDGARAAFAIYATEIGVDRLQRLMAEIAASTPDLKPTVTHFVALAAARALSGSDAKIALAHDNFRARRLPTEAMRRLSAVVAADRGERAEGDGPVTLTIVDAAGATLIGQLPAYAGAVLGVGAVTQTFRPDAAGQPVQGAEVRLLLTVGDGALPDATGLLAAVRTLLENPLALLAS